MPGSSLWLLPPQSSSIEERLADLITNIVPSIFPGVKSYPIHFPHLTLTSEIPDSVTDREGDARDNWLQSLLPSVSTLPVLRFQSLYIGDIVTQKIVLLVDKDPSLCALAVQIRAAAMEGRNIESAKQSVDKTWMPHVSLLYADTLVGPEKRLEVIEALEQTGIQFQPDGEETALEHSRLSGWEGGSILWVDTRGEIESWKVIGKLDLKLQNS